MLFIHLFLEVWGREPVLADRTESASSWPGSTGGRDKQPNLSGLSLPQTRGEYPPGVRSSRTSNSAELCLMRRKDSLENRKLILYA